MDNSVNTSTYKIKDFSTASLCIIILLLWFVALMVADYFLMTKYNNPLIILVSLALFVVVALILGLMYLKNNLVETSINEKHVEIKWIKKPCFSKRQDININWKDIKNYVFEKDTNRETFKLALKDGKKIKFIHKGIDKDDFIKFKNTFLGKVNSINSEGLFKIEIGKTIYEGISGLIFAIVIIMVMISLIILMVKNPNRALSTNPFWMVFVIGGGFFYLFKILMCNLHKFNK